MTSYEFEKAAKNAVVKIMAEQFGLKVSFRNLQVVWFTHTLGHKKCTLYAVDMGHYYAEVTYNAVKDEMYVDIYRKEYNVCLQATDMDFEAKE